MSNQVRTQQRLRITFAKGDEAKYISHLDTMRAWERALRRAGLPIAYSKGYTPHPKITFGAALPVGFTSRCEILDVILNEPTSTEIIAQSLRRALPRGLSLVSVETVDLRLPALQSQMRMAEYHVVIAVQETAEELQKRLDSLLAVPRLLRQRRRKGAVREYDLRPLINDLWIESIEGEKCTLGMRLVTNNKATGRPDEVLDALGLTESVRSIHRTRLIWED